MKIFLKWAFFNSLMVVPFVYGHYYNVEWAINIGLFFAWVTAIIGTLLIFTDVKSIDKIDNKLNEPSKIYQIYNFLFDLCFLMFIVGLGYIWLGIFYLLHMFGVYIFRKQINEKAKENGNSI